MEPGEDFVELRQGLPSCGIRCPICFARIATVAAACLIKRAHADVPNLQGWLALAKSDKTENPAKSRVLSILGPGLITGASDDDPSGIATYSQVGAQFGFSISWTMLFSYPLMAAIQEISGRIGRTTGRADDNLPRRMLRTANCAPSCRTPSGQ